MDDTKRNDIGATVFAILLGLSALFFTGWLFTAGGCSDQTDQHPIVSGIAISDDDDDDGGKGDLDSAKDAKSSGDAADAAAALRAKHEGELEEEASRRAELAEENQKLKDQLKGLKAGDGLEAEVDALKTELNSLKASQDEASGALKTQNAALNEQLAAAKTELEAAGKMALDWETKFNKTEAGRKIELDKLTAQFAASTKAEADLKTQLAASQEKAKAVDLAKSDAAKLKARVADLEKKLSDVSKERLALQNNLKGMTATGGDAAKKLQAELEALRKKAANDAKTSADKLAAAEKKLVDANKAMTDNAGAATKKLQAELAAAEKKLADANKAMADNAGAAAKKLQAELTAARKKAADDTKAWGATKGKLTGDIESLKKELADLKAKSAAMADDAASKALVSAAAGLPQLDLPLLVNDPSKLNAGFKGLFANLRGIKDNPAELEKAYAKISGDGKFEPALRVPFKSGSDFIAGDQKAKIDALAKEGGKDAKYLVVGYASTDGSNETNYKLSSKRASNVGQLIAEQVGGTENVQAVYFGQTSRFSANKSPNRVVEIWRVK